MQAVKIMPLEDGRFMVAPCEVSDEDLSAGQPAETVEEALAEAGEILRGTSETNESAEAPMMEGEAEFVAGFNKERGIGQGF